MPREKGEPLESQGTLSPEPPGVNPTSGGTAPTSMGSPFSRSRLEQDMKSVYKNKRQPKDMHHNLK